MSYNESVHMYRGLSPEQKAIISYWREALGLRTPNHRHQGASEGWSLYRMPTTINPPTTLRMHYRDANGKLQQTISITESGRNCTPWK